MIYKCAPTFRASAQLYCYS
uniref:Uncharacterized protein n=1 Tax=Anguilla anguilla TaxID=7936 RepID=A0A0E9UB72_ANGAN